MKSQNRIITTFQSFLSKQTNTFIQKVKLNQISSCAEEKVRPNLKVSKSVQMIAQFFQSNIFFIANNLCRFNLAPCPQSYTEFTYGHLDICLRFVSDLMKYPMATSVCEQDGGDLIKLDSQRKFDIFQDFVGKLLWYLIQRCLFYKSLL